MASLVSHWVIMTQIAFDYFFFNCDVFNNKLVGNQFILAAFQFFVDNLVDVSFCILSHLLESNSHLSQVGNTIVTLKANDADEGINGQVEYAIVSGDPVSILSNCL